MLSERWVGHSLGMDVHDVPSASKPDVNNTINKGRELGAPEFYTYLRLRLPLEVGMVVVCVLSVLCCYLN
jgi:Xaa-Pro dipeptidase